MGAVAATARPGHDRELMRRYYEHGDPAARDALVERFLPLARHLAARYRPAAEPMEDLVQVASLALVKAVDRYDPDRGAAFSSYAVPTILGELKRHFRTVGWVAHVPRAVQERTMLVDRELSSIAEREGRSPTPGEVAAGTGLTVEDVLEALEARAQRSAVSLDAPAGAGDDERGSVLDGLGAEDEALERVELGATLTRAWRALPPREREILRLRFGHDLTQSEIAARTGISQMHVSRLIRRALERMRRVAGEG